MATDGRAVVAVELLGFVTILGTSECFTVLSFEPVSRGIEPSWRFFSSHRATAIRDFLKMRRGANAGPATVNDIYSALQRGGFRFDTKNENNAKRGLYISLAKNAAVFHKLPGGSGDAAAVFGLTEWYPNAKTDEEPPKKKGKRKSKAKKSAAPEAAEAESPPAGKKPEKGEQHEESSSAGQRRGKKHSPTPMML